MKLEDIEIGKLYVADQDAIPFCVKVTAKVPSGPSVEVVTIDNSTGKPFLATVTDWINANRIGMLWSEFKTQQAEVERQMKLAVEAREAVANEIRASLGALGISTFFDIEYEDDEGPVLRIDVAEEDAPAFAAELARGVRQITDLRDQLEAANYERIEEG